MSTTGYECFCCCSFFKQRVGFCILLKLPVAALDSRESERSQFGHIKMIYFKDIKNRWLETCFFNFQKILIQLEIHKKVSKRF